MNQQVLNRNVEDFLKEIRSLKTKQELLTRISDYERKITQFFPEPISEKPIQNSPQYYQPQFAQNPFIQVQDSRRPSLNRTGNQFRPFDKYERNNQPLSRTESDFYKPGYEMEPKGYSNTVNRNTLPQFNNNKYYESNIQQMMAHQFEGQFKNNGYPFQSNEFLRGVADQEPDYVKFYKKQIPPLQKNSFEKIPTERHNPFQKKS